MAAENTAEEKKSRRRRRKSDSGETAEALVEESLESKGRITPGRRNTRIEQTGNALTRPFINFFHYLGEVKNEMDKVTWPTREETIRLTRIVLIWTVIASLVLGSLSLIAGEIIRLGLAQPVIFIAIMVGTIGGAFYLMRRNATTRSGY